MRTVMATDSNEVVISIDTYVVISLVIGLSDREYQIRCEVCTVYT